MVDHSLHPLKRLVREIHRRSLWQVLGIYIAASWLVLQVVDLLVDNFGLPGWFPPSALAFLLIGLPVVLATAFVQEGGPGREGGTLEGLSAGAKAQPHQREHGSTRVLTWRNALLGGLGALASWGAVAGMWLLLGGEDGRTTASAGVRIDPSIAVLPFVDLSAEGDQAYFVEGLSEEIINALAQLPSLKVSARTSAFALGDHGLDIRTIADSLGVANVLEGSVRREGDQIRITAQLIEAETGFHLWSDTYDRELMGVFAIQDEIAQAIAARLEVTLGADPAELLVTEATEDAEAHDAYLLGRYFSNQRTPESLQTGISEFQRAIDLDPLYAEAYSGLADSFVLLDAYAVAPKSVADASAVQLALDAARKAVSLDPELGTARASLGFALWLSGDLEEARGELERAIELTPGYAAAHAWYAEVLFTTGRALEAVRPAERAKELDPVAPSISLVLARALWLAGRIEDSMEEKRETTRLAPGWGPGWNDLARGLLKTGDYERGIEAWMNGARALNGDPSSNRVAYEAAIRYRETGEPQTFPEAGVSQGELPFLWAETGQQDRAVERFEADLASNRYGWALIFHVLEGAELADRPDYQSLLRNAGITW